MESPACAICRKSFTHRTAGQSWWFCRLWTRREKDSTIKHVMSGLNPQGCSVTSFKAPSAEDLDHDFLWRATRSLPARGKIGIFNRSYYEEVLVARVHPEILSREKCRQIWSQENLAGTF